MKDQKISVDKELDLLRAMIISLKLINCAFLKTRKINFAKPSRLVSC